MAIRTSEIGRLYARSLDGSTVTWYCFTNPPTEATSATPSTEVSWYRRYQSCIERSSAKSRCFELMEYMSAQPTPVASGPSVGVTFFGRVALSELRYSSTRLRAQ